MWQMERKEICDRVIAWMKENRIHVNAMGVVIALDELGFLRTVGERNKWEALKSGGPPYMVGPTAPNEDPPIAPV